MTLTTQLAALDLPWCAIERESLRRAHRAKMAALAMQDPPDDAKRAAAIARQVLLQALGLEPDEETSVPEARIRIGTLTVRQVRETLASPWDL